MAFDRLFHFRNADRLDDPERLTWFQPAEVLNRLRIEQGEVVVDLGAGTGFFTIPLATAVGRRGRVVAVDIQPEMLNRVREKARKGGLQKKIEFALADAASTGLPSHFADLVFCANVWHELDDHGAVLREARRLLKTAGRFAVLDWRTDVEVPPGPPKEHRIALEKTTGILRADGWKILSSRRIGSYSYLVQARSGRQKE